MKSALPHRVRLVLPIFVLAAGSPASAAGDRIGTVLAIRGTPVATDLSGQFRKPGLLQGVRDGETVVFKAGDRLTICNDRLGSVFEIEGPGTVSIGQGGITPLAASPRVSKTGPCDAAAADSNGGVILRGIAPKRASRLGRD